MSKLVIRFDTMDQLRDQLIAITTLYFGLTPDDNKPPEEVPTLALFTSAELVNELHRREAQDPEAVAPPPAPEPEKRRRGRPPKNAPPPQQELKLNGGEQAPEKEATPATPHEPDKEATSVAPDMPTEDQVLGLMTEVYSASGDMELVRAIMSDVGGKTQLSQIPPKLWPELIKRLSKEQMRLKGAAA